MKFLEDVVNKYNKSIIDREIVECYESDFFIKDIEKSDVNFDIEYLFFKMYKKEFINYLEDIYASDKFIAKYFQKFDKYIYIVALNYKSALGDKLNYIQLYEDEETAKNDLSIRRKNLINALTNF